MAEGDSGTGTPTLLMAGFLLLMPPVLHWLSAGLRLVFGVPVAVGPPGSPATEVLILGVLPAAGAILGVVVLRRDRERKRSLALLLASVGLLAVAVAAATLGSG